MKILMLRAEITKDNEKYMCHKKVEDEDCWYVLLINQLLLDKHVDEAQVWYFGKERKQTIYETGLVLRYENLRGKDFEPDVIFCRGGFSEYSEVIKRFPKAIKIYYGAGARFLPQDGNDYDIILTDSKDRVKKIKDKYRSSKVEILHKGCSDQLFPYKRTENKEYHLGNVTSIPTNKGQKTIGIASSGLKFLNIGQYHPDIMNRYRKWGVKASWTGRLHRNEVANYLRKCKYIFVGDHWRAGCPRVIPECMSVGVPIIILNDIPVTDRYIPDFFAVKATKNNLREKIEWSLTSTLHDPDNNLKIHNYYEENFSLKICAEKFMSYL